MNAFIKWRKVDLKDALEWGLFDDPDYFRRKEETETFTSLDMVPTEEGKDFLLIMSDRLEEQDYDYAAQVLRWMAEYERAPRKCTDSLNLHWWNLNHNHLIRDSNRVPVLSIDQVYVIFPKRETCLALGGCVRLLCEECEENKWDLMYLEEWWPGYGLPEHVYRGD